VGTAVSVILGSVCYFSNQLNAWRRTLFEHINSSSGNQFCVFLGHGGSLWCS